MLPIGVRLTDQKQRRQGRLSLAFGYCLCLQGCSMEPLDGPDVACRFQEMPMSHVFVAYFSLCSLLVLRNALVPCHYIFQKMSLSL